MLLLLDENLPKRLKNDFPGHEVFTIKERGWNTKNSGRPEKALKDWFH